MIVRETMSTATRISVLSFVAIAVIFLFAVSVSASHSWGSYHWARTTASFTLKLGDNVSSAWDSYLRAASTDWTLSNVLDTTVVAGGVSARTCKAKYGLVQVCNSTYGSNGWLGLAQIWISGNHIIAGTAKMNDTYFNKSTYNKPSWKQFVICQEVGHTFGLDHQDENHSNANLGSCMDYTNDPARNDGAGDNLHPNVHDFEQLALSYAHLDSTTTVSPSKAQAAFGRQSDDPSEWGRVVRTSERGDRTLYVREFDDDIKVFTFVIWANEADDNESADRSERSSR